MIRKIINLNKMLSKWCSRFRLCKVDIYKYYEEIVHKYMTSNQIIVDVGGGKKSCIKKFKSEYAGIKLIAIDVSDDELSLNKDVDEKVVADVTKEIPLQNESVDLIISSSVLEHLQGQEKFIKSASRILKTGTGYFIHVFPSKFSLFAIINQILPKRFSKKLLYFVFPERRKTSGFPAYYDKCYYSAMKKLLEKNGFSVEHIECTYYQSTYFGACFPVFLLSLLWDNLCCIFKIKNLCAYMCVIAKK